MTWQIAAIVFGTLNLVWAALALAGVLRFARPGAAPNCASCPLRMAERTNRVPPPLEPRTDPAE